MPLLELSGVRKSFTAPDGSVSPILDVSRLAIDAGEEVALAGSSGTGKTTLLHVIAGILRADEGEILWEEEDVAALSEPDRDLWRARNLGYVFQTFHLLQGYTALENVVLGMAFGPGPDPAFARSLLEELNLGDRLHHRPRQMSVGQQQRVALARALANRPRLVLADEPTGNLDPRLSLDLLTLFADVHRRGTTVVLATHDLGVMAFGARRGWRSVHIEAGRLAASPASAEADIVPLPRAVNT
jgi:putative ABC transport system ATP-binding protein